jgi:hypothetical protein
MLIEAVNHQYLGTNIHAVAKELVNMEKSGIDSWHFSQGMNVEDDEDDF